jgi:predicted peroxiredoxin
LKPSRKGLHEYSKLISSQLGQIRKLKSNYEKKEKNMSNENGSMVIVCNSDTAGVMPTFIMGASGVAIGEDVMLFFCPGGSSVLLKGELEKFQGKKGLPNPVELFNTILDEGGRVILCELALENKDIKKENLRDNRIEIMNAPSFLLDAQGAGITLNF